MGGEDSKGSAEFRHIAEVIAERAESSERRRTQILHSSSGHTRPTGTLLGSLAHRRANWRREEKTKDTKRQGMGEGTGEGEDEEEEWK
uniref:Uncharacterized protein n=1 Tax=Chromera velia CCMP2878 TaxID=1169474 RepID=A0A0G4I0F1_9ALVE|eukprot:Cvel_9943.t1-p1 / transcript=Cvel_9943.t1 / gene=Cvel_9943 / organism=Chromera_velia_CCMP2878 / gene_product=hypothetical protein / transcript_product=hypothetical protein / location=Cvel_scaffold588:50224-50484(-) / protein_length=87 / sequence_SO=supercontig / SO=protein_coding / is_pseudo=false